MKTKVTALPVPVSTFFVGSILRIGAILLVFLLHLLTSCQQTSTNTKATKPAVVDDETSYLYNEADTSVAVQLTSVDQLKDFAQCPTQAFTIHAKKDTIVTGSKGVKVYIPKGSFDLTDPNAEVKMVLKEFNSTKDFFLSGLTTTSNGQLLESGGTVYINASCKGKAVKIKEGKVITLAFPKGKAKPKDGMQTFYGDKQADGSINWQPGPQAITASNVAKKTWGWKNVYDTVSYPMPSTLTKAGYRVIVLTENKKCPVFEEDQGYSNVMDYLDKTLKIPAKDVEHLKGSGIEFVYSYNKQGCVTKVKLDKEALNPKYKPNIKARREAINRLNKNISGLLRVMPGIDNRLYVNERVRGCFVNDTMTVAYRYKGLHRVLMLFTDYSDCEDYSAVNLNPGKKRVKTTQVRTDDTTSAGFIKGSTGYYTLQTANLGYINCDRFTREIAKKNLYITAPFKDLEVKVIFKDIMSVMDAYETKPGSYKLENVPKGYAVKIIAIDVRADGIYYAMKDTNTNSDGVAFKDFKPMTAEAVKKELDSL